MRRVIIKAFKADNAIHRYYDADLEIANELGCVVWTRPGNEIKGAAGTLWTQDCLVRTLFVFGARLNLLEIHEPDTTPRELYMNVIAPIELLESEIRYIDHELDVRNVCSEVGDAFVLDEDDFEQAVGAYCYDQSIVSACQAAALQGKEIANAWEFKLPSETALREFARLLGI